MEYEFSSSQTGQEEQDAGHVAKGFLLRDRGI